jgi:sugar lactone lactonase YvrE
VAEYGGLIIKITPGGTKSTFVSGMVSGSFGITMDGSGNFYVINNANGKVYKVTPGGVVTTFASLGGFSSPQGICIDSSGNLYVTLGGGVVKQITSGGSVTTFVSTTLNDPWGIVYNGQA